MAHDVSFFSITTDLWSSRAKQSYIAVTILSMSPVGMANNIEIEQRN